MTSWRIRAYMAILALRHLGMAFLLILDKSRFDALASFKVLFSIANPALWATGLLVVGSMAVLALLVRKWFEEIGRGACVLSVGMSLAWASSIGLAHVESSSSSLLLFIIFLSMGLKDLIVSSMPFVDPEEILDGEMS